MGQALYRKYRSRSFGEVVGQEHIISTLQNAVMAGRISHAYLFTGPRGVGKTSVARILAHVINNLPYEDETSHLDIIEIDAASNRRIDEIRDLRDRVHIAPSSAKYKVYIIDEVHMLTKEAFNALLKTLEEPPAHCVFILATTEVHKVPETIISRTQRFHFKPISKDRAVAHLRHLAEKEGITISTEALQLLAQHGEGSFRDSISLLDQVRSGSSSVGVGEVEQALGLPAESVIRELYSLIHEQDAARLVTFLDEQVAHGYSAVLIAERLSALLRSMILDNTSEAHNLTLLRNLIDVGISQRPQELLEVILLQHNQTLRTANALSPPERNEKSSHNTPKQTGSSSDIVSKPLLQQDSMQPPSNSNLESDAVNTLSKEAAVNPSLQTEDWQTVLDVIEQLSSNLYRALRVAKAEVTDEGLILKFAFALHKKKVETSENKQLLIRAISEAGFAVPEVVLTVDKAVKVQAPPPPKQTLQDSTTQTISNIFGGAELLES